MDLKAKQLLLGLFAICLFTVAWFLTLPRGFLIGDDLTLVYGALHHGFLSNPLTSLTQVSADKYRPTLQILLSLIIPVFRTSFDAYEGLNLLVQIGNILLVGAIAWRLSRRNLLVTLVLCSAFAISRFSYYFVDQIFGLMEGLALTFLLLAVYEAMSSFVRNDPKRLFRVLPWFLLAVFTDERYVVLAVFVLACGALHPALRRKSRALLLFSLSTITIVFANYAVKTFAFGTHFLQGTGGVPIVFDIRSILTFAWDAFLNSMGFNVGPDYFSGQDVSEGGLVAYAVGVLVCVPVIAAVIGYVTWFRQRRASRFWTKVALWSSLYLPLLLSASVAYRQDTRWIYACYVALLLGIAALSGELKQADWPRARGLVSAGAVLFLVGAVGSAVYYRGFVGNIYYEQSFSIANGVISEIRRRNPNRLIIATNGNESIADWTFQNRKFFDIYGLTVAPVSFVEKVSDIAKPYRMDPHALVLDVQGSRVADVVPRVPVQYSFVENFPSGRINSEAPVQTPTKRGALVLSWPMDDHVVPSLTVLAGFRYSFSHIAITRDSVLTFDVAKPLSVGPDVRGFIDVRYAGRDKRIFSAALPPATPGGPLWKTYSIPLAAYAGRRIDVTFSSDAIAGNGLGAWVAFARPAVLKKARAAR